MKISRTTLLTGLLLAFQAVEASTKPSPHPLIQQTSPPPPPLEKKTESSKSSTDRKSTVTDTFTNVPSLTKRRPLVDAGLRYSDQDWLITLLTMPTSFILRRISFHVLFNVAISVIVAAMYPTHPNLAIPMVGHTLLASSLGLLLSYRTNSAYGRFWEARGLWTGAKSTCRNMAIVLKQNVGEHSPKAAKHMLELLAAFPSALMHLCLGGAARLPDHVTRLIRPPTFKDEYQEQYALPAMLLVSEMHKTVHHASNESKTSKTDLMEAAHLTEVSHMIGTLMNKLSNCEKILRTPVPWTYSRHTSRFVTLWMGTLPFALVGTVSRGLTIAIVAAASYCMFGIEEISHLIEQPFVGDALEGDEQVWSMVDEDGEAAVLMKRGRKTQPYDIGIPVCSLADQIRKEVLVIAAS